MHVCMCVCVCVCVRVRAHVLSRTHKPVLMDPFKHGNGMMHQLEMCLLNMHFLGALLQTDRICASAVCYKLAGHVAI